MICYGVGHDNDSSRVEDYNSKDQVSQPYSNVVYQSSLAAANYQ